MNAVTPRALRIAILALGGEGGGTLADWLIAVGEAAGWRAQGTSVPGVAQRTGATIYYVELFPPSEREPVLALMPAPGDVDLVIASELMEAGRAIQRGLVTPDRTTLVASTHRVYSMTERTAAGDGRVASAPFIAAGEAAAKQFVRADFARIADEAGTVISAALFGAVAASAALPFAREAFEAAIRVGGVGVERNLRAFAAAHDAALGREPAAPVTVRTAAPGGQLAPLAKRIAEEFPAASHATLYAAIRRLGEFQDAAYAGEFLDRLRPVLAAERRRGGLAGPLLEEAARQLAVWMSYDDAIRVADLKLRPARLARAAAEVRLDGKQLLEIDEFLRPGLEEIADVLPESLGRWALASPLVQRLAARHLGQGRVVRTSSLRGYLSLAAIAALRPWRRGSLRFRREQAQIDAWLARVVALAATDYALAVSVAALPRLIKGYGDTHRRGSTRLAHITEALGRVQRTADPAETCRRLIEVALADESGAALGRQLEELPA